MVVVEPPLIDLDPKCAIKDKVCSGGCMLPGCNRNCSKMSGKVMEVSIDLSALGPYTAGGWDFTEIMKYELGYGRITGMLQNGSYDPYGCCCAPLGYSLLMCGEDEIDFICPKLQMFGPEGEVAEGFVAPAICVCLVFFGC